MKQTAYNRITWQQDTRQACDDAAACLKTMQEIGQLRHWMGYLLEAIESEVGEDALGVLTALVDDRQRNGGW